MFLLSFFSSLPRAEVLPSPLPLSGGSTSSSSSSYFSPSPPNNLQYDYNNDNKRNSYSSSSTKTNPKPIVDIIDDYDDFKDESMLGEDTHGNRPIDTEVVPLDQQANWQWCLLTLDGNATILRMRKQHFIRYFRMNLASLIGSDYDSVLFNSVSYTPAILVNVTLNWHGRTKRIVNRLGELAQRNDTLLDLSGSHFNVTNFLPWSAIMAPKPVSPMDNRVNPREMEAFIFMAVGATIVFLLVASMMFAVCQCIARPKHTSAAANGHTYEQQDKQLVRRY